MQEIEPLNGTRGSRSTVRKYLDSRDYMPWIVTRPYFRKTERRITFQRGDFIRFDRNNDIILGSIENIFVHEVTVKEIPGAMLRTMGAP